MALHRQRQLLARDTAAIVAHPHQAEAALLRLDLDMATAGVEAVLDQFLDHARGTLDHLAGGDAVDDLFGELADGHGTDCRKDSDALL
mgnify:CR=1 FL=1